MAQEIKHTDETTQEHVVVAPDLTQRNAASDELGLFELWAILSRKRALILGVVAASLMISMTVAFTTPPVYQASIHFQPPLPKDVGAFNIQELGKEYTSDDVYQTFQRNFRSRINLWEFFIDNRLYEAYIDGNGVEDFDIETTFEEKFLGSIKLYQPDVEQFFSHATLDWKDPVQGALMLNAYSQSVYDKTLTQLIDEVNSKISIRKEEARAKIESLRRAAQSTKNDRLAVLDENINIAKELGIKRQKGISEEKASDIFVEVFKQQALYYQGYEVLEAEKRALLARKNNDPFTPGLDKALQQLDDLNSIRISADQVSAVQISQQAKALPVPAKPRKKLIVVLGAVLGLFLGTLVAFISHAVSGQRTQ